MPNHIHNILTLTGSAEEIARFATLVNTKGRYDPDAPEYADVDPSELSLFDFNALIPMPTDVYRGALGYEERQQYGRNNWYDWSVDHWGTKWNAYDIYWVNDDEYRPGDTTYAISFDTAWAAPDPIYKAIAKQFPTLSGEAKFADEDMGSNCGIWYINDGHASLWDAEESGWNDAIIHACKVWYDSDPEDNDYRINPKTGLYEYHDPYDDEDEDETDAESEENEEKGDD